MTKVDVLLGSLSLEACFSWTLCSGTFVDQLLHEVKTEKGHRDSPTDFRELGILDFRERVPMLCSQERLLTRLQNDSLVQSSQN